MVQNAQTPKEGSVGNLSNPPTGKKVKIFQNGLTLWK